MKKNIAFINRLSEVNEASLQQQVYLRKYTYYTYYIIVYTKNFLALFYLNTAGNSSHFLDDIVTLLNSSVQNFIAGTSPSPSTVYFGVFAKFHECVTCFKICFCFVTQKEKIKLRYILIMLQKKGNIVKSVLIALIFSAVFITSI